MTETAITIQVPLDEVSLTPCKDDQKSITSCDVVFGISPKNAPFQTQIIDLDLKTHAISEDIFFLDRR